MQLVLRRPESGSQKSFFVKINQTQEVFIMDFRHSYVYIYIYMLHDYTKIYQSFITKCSCFPWFLALHIPKNPTISNHRSPRLHLPSATCTEEPEALTQTRLPGSWSEAKAPTKTGRKLLPYNFLLLPCRELTYSLRNSLLESMIFRTSCLVVPCVFSFLEGKYSTHNVQQFLITFHNCCTIAFQG